MFSRATLDRVLKARDRILFGTCGPGGRQSPTEKFELLSGILLAACELSAHGNRERAVKVLQPWQKNELCKGVLNHLKNANLSEESKLFESVLPFKIWTRTPFCKRQRDLMLAAIKKSAATLPCRDRGRPACILDIGPGDGSLLCALADIVIHEHKLERLRLVLVDVSEGVLGEAAAYCYERIRIPTEVVTICSPIESITESDLKSWKKFDIWITIAVASLHHMPHSQKIKTLTLLSQVAPILFIEELEGNHDIPPAIGPELVCSVVEFYGSLIDDVVGAKLSARDTRVCLDQFILAEAVTILTSDRSGRQNFHCTRDQWIDLLDKTGYSVACADYQRILHKAPRGIFLDVRIR